jgi:hypothetical protein
MWKQKCASPCLLIGLIFIPACRSENGRPALVSPSNEVITSSTPPFQTKEPERYQAVRTITFNAPGQEPVVTRYRIARNGSMRREEGEAGGDRRVVYLDLPDGQFVILPEEKIYAEFADDRRTDSSTQPLIESSAERLLHIEPISTRYQKLGAELLNGRNSIKYRVIVNNSAPGSVSNTETLIWIDETLGMPIKSEISTADGSRTTMELSAISLSVDKDLFQIPVGYEKVKPGMIRQHRGKSE